MGKCTGQWPDLKVIELKLKIDPNQIAYSSFEQYYRLIKLNLIDQAVIYKHYSSFFLFSQLMISKVFKSEEKQS